MPLHRDIHWIGRQWAVTGHGMQLIDQKLKGFFDVEVARLWDDALIATTRAKEWLHGADFEKGLDVARKRFPRDGVTPPAESVAAAPPVVSAPPVAPAPAVELAPAPEARPAAPVTPVAPAPPKAPTAPVIVSVKPASQQSAPAPTAKFAELPLHELEGIEPTRSAGKFHMGFSGYAKFIRPWRVRMKE